MSLMMKLQNLKIHLLRRGLIIEKSVLHKFCVDKPPGLSNKLLFLNVIQITCNCIQIIKLL